MIVFSRNAQRLLDSGKSHAFYINGKLLAATIICTLAELSHAGVL